MFGIKKLKERIERLEKNQEVDHTLVDKLRKFLKFTGFDYLPTYPEAVYMESWVIRDLIKMVLQQQELLEELSKKV